MTIYQQISDQPDNRTKTGTATSACQLLKQSQQDIDMNGQKRIEVGKQFAGQWLHIQRTLHIG